MVRLERIRDLGKVYFVPNLHSSMVRLERNKLVHKEFGKELFTFQYG